jgi:putative DNA primase/helicase
MEFLQFCKAHGILIDHYPPVGTWKRFATETHPRKRNGAVKYMIDHAFICDWAAGSEVHIWKADADVKVDRNFARRLAEEAKRKVLSQQEQAAKKAGWIMHQTQIGMHPYLKAKGFYEEPGNVWVKDGVHILVIPMRVDGRLVGCQLIDPEGKKRFLFGQRTNEAEFVFDNKGRHVLCEGYATALSVRHVLRQMKERYTLHVCFSAGNMVKVAARLPGGVVVADNDESGTGEEAAKKIGWPYYMAPEIGDFNDWHQKVGAFKAGMALRKLMHV